MDKDKRIKKLEGEVVELRKHLRHDELTDVLNRKGLLEELENIFDEVSYHRKHPDASRKINVKDLSLIFIDIDDFKTVNDNFGHDAGDEALRAVADMLASNVRGIDVVGRFGGEEFIIGLVGANEKEGLKKAEELRSLIQDVNVDGYPQIRLTGSLGVVSVREGGFTNLKDLIKAADEAMYEAKKNRGKNTVVTSSMSLNPPQI